jgi:hypothetical protein
LIVAGNAETVLFYIQMNISKNFIAEHDVDSMSVQR